MKAESLNNQPDQSKQKDGTFNRWTPSQETYASDHEHKAAKAAAVAKQRIDDAENQAARTDNSVTAQSQQAMSQDIDLRHEHTETAEPIESANAEQIEESGLEQLADVEFQARKVQAMHEVQNAEPGSEEFEQAYQRFSDMTRETIRRRQLAKENSDTPVKPAALPDYPDSPGGKDPTGETANAEHMSLGEKLRKKIKDRPAFKKAVTVAAATALAAVVGVGFFMIGSANSSVDNAEAGEGAKTERAANQHNRAKVGSEESYLGKFANDDGTTYNADKSATVNFAGADLLGNARGDVQASKDAIKDVSMQVETLSGYLAALSDQDRADLGVGGLNLQEINQKLESDSDFCEQVSAKFLKLVDEGTISYENLENGSYDNLYMDFVDQGGGANKDNIKVVYCTTAENGTPVTVLRVHDSVLVLKDDCTQPVKEQGGWGSIIEGTNVIPQPEPGPGPQPQPDPPGPTPWGKSGDTHAGDGIFNKDLVNPGTGVTEYQSDHANDGNKGGQTGTDTGVVDRGGNAQQKDSPDRGVDHSDQQEEERAKKGDF